MRSEWVFELLPNHEFLPPFKRFPTRTVRRKEKEPFWQEGYRWCACQSFLVYGFARSYDRRFWDQGGVDPVTLRPCVHVTRDVFTRLHWVGIVDALAEAKGFGFKACLTDDLTPRDPFEVAELFGNLVINDVHRQKVKNVQKNEARRKIPFKVRMETAAKMTPGNRPWIAEEVRKMV